MTDHECALLRLDCLRLAIPLVGNCPEVADIAKTATQLYAFIATPVSGKPDTGGQRKKDKTAFG